MDYSEHNFMFKKPVCDVVDYPAGRSHQTVAHCGHKCNSVKAMCLNDARLVLKGPECAKKISPPTNDDPCFRVVYSTF